MKQQTNKRVRRRLASQQLGAMLIVAVGLAGCTLGKAPDEQSAFAAAATQAAPVPVEMSTPVPLDKLIWVVPRSKSSPAAASRDDRPAESPRATIGPRAAGSLLWPVQGRVRHAFGAQPSGTRNDGLDIVASEGALVVAADSGIVTYAGNELQGYGNMLLIVHGGGHTTVYAHNQALLVGVGTSVHRGQPIAKVGRTGGVDNPQLHFQLRTGERPVDPEPYLEPVTTVVASLAADLPARSGGE